MKNEVVKQEKQNPILPPLSIADAVSKLTAAIGVSPLAVGTKFESDDLVNADYVRLKDFDWISYRENKGSDDEKEVNYSLWSVTVYNDDKIENGYYQAGVVLGNLARSIEEDVQLREFMDTYGICVIVQWSKTNSKNPIITVQILNDEDLYDQK